MRGIAIAVLLSVVGLAGCGGSSGEASLSDKERYLARAEAICAAANTDLAKVKKTQPTSTDLLPAFVKAIVDVGRTNVTQLEALTPPAADKAALTAKVITPLKEQVDIGDAYTAKVAKAVKDKDPALLGLISNPPTQTKADLAFMRGYGFTACVKAADTANA